MMMSSMYATPTPTPSSVQPNMLRRSTKLTLLFGSSQRSSTQCVKLHSSLSSAKRGSRAPLFWSLDQKVSGSRQGLLTWGSVLAPDAVHLCRAVLCCAVLPYCWGRVAKSASHPTRRSWLCVPGPWTRPRRQVKERSVRERYSSQTAKVEEIQAKWEGATNKHTHLSKHSPALFLLIHPPCFLY